MDRKAFRDMRIRGLRSEVGIDGEARMMPVCFIEKPDALVLLMESQWTTDCTSMDKDKQAVCCGFFMRLLQ